MKHARPLLCCVAALLAAPAVAAAGLSLRIGPQPSPSTPDAVYTIPSPPGTGLPPGKQFFDLVFTETGPAANENLFAYDLSLRVVAPSGAAGGGLRLAGAEIPPENYVFDVPSGSQFNLIESDADHVLINVASNDDAADITTGKVAARIFYTLAPDTAPGEYRLDFGTPTAFGSGDPNQALFIPVELTDAGLVSVRPAAQAIPLPRATWPGLILLAGLVARSAPRRRLRPL
jgi:hypothetical protein